MAATERSVLSVKKSCAEVTGIARTSLMFLPRSP